MPNIAAELRDAEVTVPLFSIKEIIHRYHGSLISFLRNRVRTPEDAADVAQEAYIRLIQYEGSREVHSPSSLLFRIAINLANDLGRAEQVRRVTDRCALDEAEVEPDRITPERTMSAEQELESLLAVIEHLPPKCQQVFLLSRVQCMTYAQIAKHCGISVKMVEKHISHALAACMKSVES